LACFCRPVRPPEIARKLHDEAVQAMQSPAVREKLASSGFACDHVGRAIRKIRQEEIASDAVLAKAAGNCGALTA